MDIRDKIKWLVDQRSGDQVPQRGGVVWSAVRELAKDLNVNERTVFRWLAGEKRPAAPTAKLIETMFENEKRG